jgi:thiamine biosynthesis lipoprotein
MKMNRRSTLIRLSRWVGIGGGIACSILNANSAFPFSPELRAFETEFLSMGSKMNLRWYDERTESHEFVLTIARSISEKWVSILSDYEPDSEAMTVNRQADAGDWVEVSAELWEVIATCDEWNKKSNGAFDAALGSVTRLRRQKKLATAKQWNEAKTACGWKLLDLDPGRQAIRMQRPGVRFDFGAIGKGIVVDRISGELTQHGIERFVVNSSGNMRMGMPPPTSQGWPVAIDIPPEKTTDEPVEYCRMRLNRCGVATSGDRWQRFPDPELDAIRTTEEISSSHILDPKSLRGIRGHHNVTVIAPSATDADAIATTTSVRIHADLPGWLDTIRRMMPDVQVLILSRSEATGEIHVRNS